MSNQSVIIKSNRYGLIVILDEKPDWETIKKEVAEKFSASAKFFGNAQMALCFQGRTLSMAEEQERLESIPGMVPSMLDLPNGCYFAPRCKYCQEICRTQAPTEQSVGDGHVVCCHFPLKGGD